ncbi:MAG TPA: hypothetical protein VFE33_03230 [Thermoanaerobaculia bacterium]|nr:hypothetical protein [Thermoanaerobaculia bacterium]
MQNGRAGVGEVSKHLKTGTMGEIYHYLNAPETLAASHRPTSTSPSRHCRESEGG